MRRRTVAGEHLGGSKTMIIVCQRRKVQKRQGSVQLEDRGSRSPKRGETAGREFNAAIVASVQKSGGTVRDESNK